MLRRCTLAIALLLGSSACDHETPSAEHTASPPADARTTTPTPPRDAGAPADRVAVRRLITLYNWSSTEPGNETTDQQSIEHGTSQLHIYVEVHQDAQRRGWVMAGALAGTVGIPEDRRMRPNASSSEWHIPSGAHIEFSLDQFGGTVRPGEPLHALVSTSPNDRVEIPVGPTPTMVRIPASGTFADTPNAAVGQYDAIVTFLVPVTTRHGGRDLVYALDLLAEAGGFVANGVMPRAPTTNDLERYFHWMRDRNGIGHSNPPIPMIPLDRH